MANYLHRTTKQYTTSVSPNDLQEPEVNYVVNPDLSAVEGFPSIYWIITGDVVTLMDQAARDTVDADIVIVPDIYDARSDIETEHVDIQQFLEDIAIKSRVEVLDGVSLEETQKTLQDTLLQPNDVLVCMGAGTITELAEALVS